MTLLAAMHREFESNNIPDANPFDFVLHVDFKCLDVEMKLCRASDGRARL